MPDTQDPTPTGGDNEPHRTVVVFPSLERSVRTLRKYWGLFDTDAKKWQAMLDGHPDIEEEALISEAQAVSQFLPYLQKRDTVALMTARGDLLSLVFRCEELSEIIEAHLEERNVYVKGEMGRIPVESLADLTGPVTIVPGDETVEDDNA